MSSGTLLSGASFVLFLRAKFQPTAKWQPPLDIRSTIGQWHGCCVEMFPIHCRGSASLGLEGEIKLKGEAAAEQHLRLTMEGVKFQGKRINMEIYEYTLRSWETFD